MRREPSPLHPAFKFWIHNILTPDHNNYRLRKGGYHLAHTLAEMKVANISEEGLQKLQNAEKAINSIGGGTQDEEIYLLALTRQGR
jgi:hypothetical protein